MRRIIEILTVCVLMWAATASAQVVILDSRVSGAINDAQRSEFISSIDEATREAAGVPTTLAPVGLEECRDSACAAEIGRQTDGVIAVATDVTEEAEIYSMTTTIYRLDDGEVLVERNDECVFCLHGEAVTSVRDNISSSFVMMGPLPQRDAARAAAAEQAAAEQAAAEQAAAEQAAAEQAAAEQAAAEQAAADEEVVLEPVEEVAEASEAAEAAPEVDVDATSEAVAQQEEPEVEVGAETPAVVTPIPVAVQADESTLPWIVGDVRVEIEVQPSNATILVNGRSVGRGRTVVRVASPQSLEIRAAAPGYLVSTEVLNVTSSDESLSTSLVLEEEPRSILGAGDLRVRRGIAGTMIGLGAGALAGGIYLIAIDGNTSCGSDVPDSACPEIYNTTAAGATVTALGAAAIGGGIALLLTGPKEGDEAEGASGRASLPSVAPIRGGAAASWRLSF